jgi:hypothetical protein
MYLGTILYKIFFVYLSPLKAKAILENKGQLLWPHTVRVVGSNPERVYVHDIHDTIYQNVEKYTNLPQHYQVAVNYTKWP